MDDERVDVEEFYFSRDGRPGVVRHMRISYVYGSTMLSVNGESVYFEPVPSNWMFVPVGKHE